MAKNSKNATPKHYLDLFDDYGNLEHYLVSASLGLRHIRNSGRILPDELAAITNDLIAVLDSYIDRISLLKIKKNETQK